MRDRGTTLIEVMVATAMLTIATGVAFNALRSERAFTQAAAARRLAALALQEEAELLRRVPVRDLLKGPRDFSCADCLARLPSARGTVTPRPASGGSVELTLGVEWSGPGGRREEAHLSALRAPWREGR